GAGPVRALAEQRRAVHGVLLEPPQHRERPDWRIPAGLTRRDQDCLQRRRALIGRGDLLGQVDVDPAAGGRRIRRNLTRCRAAPPPGGGGRGRRAPPPPGRGLRGPPRPPRGPPGPPPRPAPPPRACRLAASIVLAPTADSPPGRRSRARSLEWPRLTVRLRSS